MKEINETCQPRSLALLQGCWELVKIRLGYQTQIHISHATLQDTQDKILGVCCYEATSCIKKWSNEDQSDNPNVSAIFKFGILATTHVIQNIYVISFSFFFQVLIFLFLPR
jgi:hypothetical protein